MKWLYYIPFLFMFLPNLAYSKDKIRVGILDTGIDINNSEFRDILCDGGASSSDFTGTTLNDVNGHGSDIVRIIKNYAREANYCIIMAKYYVENDHGSNVDSFTEGLHYLSALGANIINISGGGKNDSKREQYIMSHYKNISYFVAAGNNGTNLDTTCNYFPACYKLPNVTVVGALDERGAVLNISNYGSFLKWELGSLTLEHNSCDLGVDATCEKTSTIRGTSVSTAVYTGKAIYELWQRH